MDNIEKIFNFRIKYINEPYDMPLPNYIRTRYGIRLALFDRQRVIVLVPKIKLDETGTIKRHVEKIKQYENIPVVIMLDKITVRERQGLLESGIPFLVKNKQCFLPFLGTLLTERCDAKSGEVDKLLPSAQMLLFYYIYENNKELYIGNAVETLSVSAMTITRAARQLEQVGLFKFRKDGVKKIMTTEYSGKELYEQARPYLSTPVKRTVYIFNDQIDDTILMAGDLALSQMSMLNPPRVSCYATSNIQYWGDKGRIFMSDEDNQSALQIWKYNPNVLSRTGCVDVLSLAACYLDDPDERVEECIDEMLEDLWEGLNGKRV